MDDQKKATAKTCLEGAETNTMTFPQILGVLIAAGFATKSTSAVPPRPTIWPMVTA